MPSAFSSPISLRTAVPPPGGAPPVASTKATPAAAAARTQLPQPWGCGAGLPATSPLTPVRERQAPRRGAKKPAAAASARKLRSIPSPQGSAASPGGAASPETTTLGAGISPASARRRLARMPGAGPFLTRIVVTPRAR